METLTTTLNELQEFWEHKLTGPTWKATQIWFAMWGFLLACYYLIPCRREKGVPLKDGSRLEYRINGMASFVLFIAAFYTGVFLNYWPATILMDEFYPLFAVANIFSIAMVLFLYIKGKFFSKDYVSHGNPLSDIWYGVELNPRVLGFDFKYFSYRPLIMFWAMFILTSLHVQWQATQSLPIGLILYFVFTWTYTIDYLWVEHKICTTWDVIAEDFGFGLVWGDHVFYPYFYSVQMHYLLDLDGTGKDLALWKAMLIIVVFVAGYTIFRSANNQKDAFKRYRGKTKIWGKPVRTTKDGRLLMSGWWGIGRHINYLGDILIAVGWTLPCGFQSLVPWTHSMFFIPFLMHREHRDEKRMRQKYGKTYEEYCKVAKWRIFPFIY